MGIQHAFEGFSDIDDTLGPLVHFVWNLRAFGDGGSAIAYGHMSHVLTIFRLPLLAALVAISDDPMSKTAGSLLRCDSRYPSLRGLGI